MYNFSNPAPIISGKISSDTLVSPIFRHKSFLGYSLLNLDCCLGLWNFLRLTKVYWYCVEIFNCVESLIVKIWASFFSVFFKFSIKFDTSEHLLYFFTQCVCWFLRTPSARFWFVLYWIIFLVLSWFACSHVDLDVFPCLASWIISVSCVGPWSLECTKSCYLSCFPLSQLLPLKGVMSLLYNLCWSRSLGLSKVSQLYWGISIISNLTTFSLFM